MSKKKSKARGFTKRFLLIVQLLISALFLYPIFFAPLSLIWINGFLGIAAPYLVAASLLFFIIWLLAKPILSIIPLVTLILGWATILVLFAWHPGTMFNQKKKPNLLRIASWNVKEFNGNEKIISAHKFRAEEIAYSIQKWNPDIICMQEYNTNERPNDAANHAQYFEKKYPFSFRMYYLFKISNYKSRANCLHQPREFNLYRHFERRRHHKSVYYPFGFLPI